MVKKFLTRLLATCPSLPYMALGLALVWFFIAYSGTAWLSDTEIDGTNISTLFIMISSTAGMALVAVTVFVPQVKRLLSKPAFVVGGSAVASIGCFVVIAIGPYYLAAMMPSEAVMALFFGGGALGGLGIAAVYLKCAEMYGKLPPRRVILYTAFSHIVVGVVYFVVIGSPDWAPVKGGPSLVGIIAFVCLPLLAGLCAAMSFFSPAASAHTDDGDAAASVDRKRSLSRPFWKLVVVVLVFSLVMTAVRASSIAVVPVDQTFENTRLVMLLHMAIAVCFAAVAIVTEGDLLDFGKVYSVIMAIGVVFVSLIPAVGFLHEVLNQLVSVVVVMFEFVLWCILAFIVYQKRISSILVFGLAFGGYQLGSCMGWIVGAYAFKMLPGGSSNLILYLVLAGIVLVCAFILFSEKEFDNLFRPASREEQSLEDLLREGLGKESGSRFDEKGRFVQVVDAVAQDCRLSKRETDVFRYLAMGYDSYAIARKLQVSWNTVRTHTRNVYAKLDVHSRQELIDLVDRRLRSS